ncbi:MAG: AAA family ATPase [Clostridium sp.]
MDISEETGRAFRGMVEEAERLHLEYVTPELLLLHIAAEPAFQEAFENCQGEIGRLAEQLEDYVNGLPVLSEEKRKEGAEPEPSADLNELLLTAEWAARSSGRKEVALSHLVSSYFSLKESFALYYLTEQGIEKGEFLLALIEAEEKDGGDEPSAACLYSAEETGLGGKEEAEKLDEAEDAEDLEDEEDAEGPENRRGNGRWKRFAVCLNEEISQANPLIGREKELERTMQILCRKEKNNPLHIGEPGVGKTAVVYGLARLLSEGKVPEPLKGAKIYALDLGGMLAGTQYRGDFEKRLKSVLSGLSQEEKPIVYLDEIHNIVGAGAAGEGSLDASNLLKPYLASGKIRFIGATTHEEYKRYFEKSRSLARRFQNVEIAEPGEDEAAEILLGLKTRYEEYHGVSYQNGVIEYMVHMSAKYINERFLPDKAIDLMDEAGAYRKLHPLAQKRQTVGKDVVDEILSKICRIPRQTVESSETRKLALLEKRLAS